MKLIARLTLSSCLCVLASSAASATTIDFGTLPGVNGDTFTTYSENNYTVTAATGSWSVGTFFGDPTPNIFSSAGSVNVTQDVGTFFTFSGVDLANAVTGGRETYTITGFLAGNQAFTETGTLTFGSFAEVGTGFSGDTIDRLKISFSGVDDSNIDNINVNPVLAGTPEPDSLALVLTGAVGMAAALRRRLGRFAR